MAGRVSVGNFGGGGPARIQETVSGELLRPKSDSKVTPDSMFEPFFESLLSHLGSLLNL